MRWLETLPDCPGRPEHYTLVRTKEGVYWRLKRGSRKPATLNESFSRSKNLTSMVAPVAKRIRDALRPWIRSMQTSRLQIRICMALRKSFKEQGQLKLAALKGLELAEEKLGDLLDPPVEVRVDESRIRVGLPIDYYTFKHLNNLVTHAWIEAVVVFGDPNRDDGLHTESVSSPLYAVRSAEEHRCELQLDLPPVPDWCLVVTVSCLEGHEMAHHAKWYRGRVVG